MILVIGATGTVGSRVLVQLRAAGAAVTALVRDSFSDAGRALRDAGVEVADGDLERPKTLAARPAAAFTPLFTRHARARRIMAPNGLE
jgi:uncharacterized protein YbjT (DUF2867 family)